jgi:O-antigen/teichoic acid export membrane protein
MFGKIKSFLFKNKTTSQTVAKNTVWLTISNFGGRLIRAAVVIYGARILGTAGWGVFSYAITLAGFMSLFMDPGINAILTRNISRASEEDRRAIFSTTLLIKLVLLIIGVLIIVFIAPLFSTLPGTKILLPIVALILGFDTLRDFFSSLMRAREKMEWDAGIFILVNITILIFGFIFLARVQSPSSLAWAYVTGTVFGTIIAIIVLKEYFREFFSYVSWKLVAPTLQSAWPFAVTSALGMLLTNTDILIISWMRTASDVGIYSAAIRIIQVLYLVPTIVQFSTLPLLSRLAKKDNEKFRRVLEQTLRIIFLISIPLVVGGIILGTPLIVLIFGANYIGGSLAFKILMLTMLVDFPAAIISNSIFAYDHQKNLIVASAIGGVLNVVLDVLFIPRFGITGSAVATLIAQTASNWYLWHAMKKINYFTVLPRLAKPAIAGIVMGLGCVLFMALGVNVAVNIIISGAIYAGLLWMLREPILKDMKNILAPSGIQSL